MTEFIQLLLIGCLWIWGVNMLFKKGEILGSVGDALRAGAPKWFVKPTIGCPACMTSFHGTLIYFCAVDFFETMPTVISNHMLLFWPFFMICLVGINHIIIEHLYDTTE